LQLAVLRYNVFFNLFFYFTLHLAIGVFKGEAFAQEKEHVFVREREKEREKERKKERERETHTHTQKESLCERERKRERERGREREKEREKERTSLGYITPLILALLLGRSVKLALQCRHSH
jgi:alpha-galactosidase/6-phospho-beta-glucosidase family protein